MSKSAREITVGDVLRYLQKDSNSARCIACVSQKACPFNESCAFSNLWQRVKVAAYDIYDETTMQDLLLMNEPAEALATRN